MVQWNAFRFTPLCAFVRCISFLMQANHLAVIHSPTKVAYQWHKERIDSGQFSRVGHTEGDHACCFCFTIQLQVDRRSDGTRQFPHLRNRNERRRNRPHLNVSDHHKINQADLHRGSTASVCYSHVYIWHIWYCESADCHGTQQSTHLSLCICYLPPSLFSANISITDRTVTHCSPACHKVTTKNIDTLERFYFIVCDSTIEVYRSDLTLSGVISLTISRVFPGLQEESIHANGTTRNPCRREALSKLGFFSYYLYLRLTSF